MARAALALTLALCPNVVKSGDSLTDKLTVGPALNTFCAAIFRNFSFAPYPTPFDNPRQIDYLSHSPCVSIITWAFTMATNMCK